MKTLLQRAYREGEKYQRGLMREHRRGRKHCFTVPPSIGYEVGYIAWSHITRRAHYQRKSWSCKTGALVRIEWTHRRVKRGTHH